MSSISSQIGNAALKTTMQLGMIASFVSLVASNVLYTIDPSQSTNYSYNSSSNNNSNNSSSFFDNLFNGEYNPHIRKSQAILGLIGAMVSSGALIPQIWHNYKTKTAPFKLSTLYLFISGGILGTIATSSITDVNNYLLWVANAANIISTVERVTLLIQNLMYSKEGNKKDLSPKDFLQELNKFLKIFIQDNQNEADQIIDIDNLVKQISEKNKDLLDNNELANKILANLGLNQDDINSQKIFQAFKESKLSENIDQNVKKVLEEFEANIENNLKNPGKYIDDLNKEIEETKKLLKDLEKENKKKYCNRFFDRNLQNNIKETKKKLNELEKTKQELINDLKALSKLGKFFKEDKQNQGEEKLINENTKLFLKNTNEHKATGKEPFNSSISGTVW